MIDSLKGCCPTGVQALSIDWALSHIPASVDSEGWENHWPHLFVYFGDFRGPLRLLASPNSGLRGLSKNFSLLCKSEPELEDWCIVKRKMYWDRSKSFSASECSSLVWLRSAPQTATTWNPFFLKCHAHRLDIVDKATFVTWKRQPFWYWVDTSWY